MPTSAIYGYSADTNNAVEASFMLMDCLSGNVTMNLHFSYVPIQHQPSFYAEMTRFQMHDSSKTMLPGFH
jgi:hypothetical protein